MTPYKETAKAFPLIVLWVALGFLIIAAVTIGWLKLSAPIQNAQTDIDRSTNQYQATVQQHLVTDMQAIRDNEVLIAKADPSNTAYINALTSTDNATLTEMSKQIATIKPNQVPSDVQAFMAEHGR